MTSHLSSRVLWNWRKRERGKEALPRVRDSASSERENIENCTSLLSRVHVGRDAQERIPTAVVTGPSLTRSIIVCAPKMPRRAGQAIR